VAAPYTAAATYSARATRPARATRTARATRPASVTYVASATTLGKHCQPTTVVGIANHFRGRHCHQNWELWDAEAMAGCWGCRLCSARFCYFTVIVGAQNYVYSYL